MKRIIPFVLFVAMAISVFSQDDLKKEDVKTGWNFGVLPAITYNTDLGFQYGGLINLFHYGDGSKYPAYLHNIYFEICHYTKGSGIYRLAYDSEFLIPGIRITSDLAYLPDEAFDFYGFNGYEAVFNKNWIDDEAGAGIYKTRMFYKLQNKTFRFKTDIQFPIQDDQLKALVGFNLQKYNIDKVNIDKLNKGKDANDPKALPANEPTLYDNYIDWGLINADEKDGGFIPLLKAGLVYDTRDNEPNPMKGMWTELFVFGAPTFLGAESGFVKLNITHRQYFTIVPKNLSFAYRLGFQSTLSGDVPFYYQPQIETSMMKDQLGLGGNKTLRGVIRNRVVGNGFVYGNAELRWKAVHFNWINQKFYLGLNAFCDAGQVIQKIDIEKKVTHIATLSQTDYFNLTDGESLHMSYGAGLRVVMNQNFIVSLDYGRAVNAQDGSSGMYIGLGYLF